MALAIYGRRKARKEHSSVSQYGYRTWWLTGESRFLVYAERYVKGEGATFIMRSDFIVRFLSLVPSAAEVRRAYGNIFPSLLGLRLARRVNQKEISKHLQELAQTHGLEEGRRLAKIADLSDKLKTKFFFPLTTQEDLEEEPG